MRTGGRRRGVTRNAPPSYALPAMQANAPRFERVHCLQRRERQPERLPQEGRHLRARDERIRTEAQR